MNGMLVPPSSLRHKNERRRLKLEKRVRFAEAPEYFNEDASPAVTEPDLAEEQDSKAPVSPSEDPGNRPRRLSRGVSFLGSKYLSPENPLLQDDEYLRLLERVGEGDGGETESLGLLEGDVWGEIAVEYD
jgi:hypothetical protein